VWTWASERWTVMPHRSSGRPWLSMPKPMRRSTRPTLDGRRSWATLVSPLLHPALSRLVARARGHLRAPSGWGRCWGTVSRRVHWFCWVGCVGSCPPALRTFPLFFVGRVRCRHWGSRPFGRPLYRKWISSSHKLVGYFSCTRISCATRESVKHFTEMGLRIWMVLINVVGGLELTCFIFPFSWEFHHPNWRTHIFQRGKYTTNQKRLNPVLQSNKNGLPKVTFLSWTWLWDSDLHQTGHIWSIEDSLVDWLLPGVIYCILPTSTGYWWLLYTIITHNRNSYQPTGKMRWERKRNIFTGLSCCPKSSISILVAAVMQLDLKNPHRNLPLQSRWEQPNG